MLPVLLLLALLALALASPSTTTQTTTTAPTYPFPWLDPSLPLSTRVSSFIANLTLADKVDLLQNGNAPIPRLGLPNYDWWSEASHGIAWGGKATAFPSPIGMAATWNRTLLLAAGRVVSNEARGRYNDYRRRNNNDSTTFYGLNFYAPNINMFVHSQWGRGQETFGEDMVLTGQLAAQYVHGIQGNETGTAKYLQAGGTAKHFFVFNYANNVNSDSVNVSIADLRLTYLPAFKTLVQQGKVESVMCSYNAINGPPACAHPYLQTVLRDEWGFQGFVTSDAGAISLIVDGHHYASNYTEASALAINAGCDNDLGNEYNALPEAISLGLTTVATLDRSLARLTSRRIREGAFDPPELVPWSKYGLEQVDTPASRALAKEAAVESIVLLKNDGAFLPLTKSSFPKGRIAVVGPNADRPYGVLGNYPPCLSGPYSDVIPECVLRTPLWGIQSYVQQHWPNVAVTFDAGLPDLSSYNTSLIQAAIHNASMADVVIVVGGLGTCEVPDGGPGPNCLEAEGLDRNYLALPPIQQLLLDKLTSLGVPVVLVTMGGAPLALGPSVLSPAIPSMLHTWYGGEEAGTALADILFGTRSPSGKLPVTFPLDDSQLPAYWNDSVQALPCGRTYRYTTCVPLYAFSYGLSYTQFAYSPRANRTSILSVSHVVANDTTTVVQVQGEVSNVGQYANTDEVVMAFVTVIPFAISGQMSPPSLPRTELKAFARLPVTRAHSPWVFSLPIPIDELRLLGDDSEWALLQGVYVVYAGGSAPGSRGMFVDGHEQYGRVVEYEMPEACSPAVRKAWARQQASRGLAVNELQLEMGMAGGLVGTFTVC